MNSAARKAGETLKFSRTMESNEMTGLTSGRRGFLKKAAAVIVGGIAGLVPALAGLMVLLDPLRRKAAAGSALKVTTLDALPPDGVPRRFSVLADRTDAWNKYLNVPIGAVYLRRTGADKVEALNVVCPHAGCFVDFNSDRGRFRCPCHNSTFTVDGKIDSPTSPAPRGLDSLPAEVRNGEVWVVFQNFKAGQKEKVPVA
jgi:menaquinol-cytochrome c reductase iron-sulfur subunit